MRSTKFLALVSASVLLSACGEKIAESILQREMQKDGFDGQVEIENGRTRFETDEGTATFGKGEFPEGWPEEVEAYPGSQIYSSVSFNEDAGESGMFVILMTTDDYATVFAYYQRSLTEAGWAMGNVTEEESGPPRLTGTKDGLRVSLEAQTLNAIAIGISPEE